MTIRSMAKKFIAYTIEDEYKCYRLKHTPMVYRRKFTAAFHKKYGDMPVCKNKVVFNNYMGAGYGCNGKYVLEELLRTEPEFSKKLDLVWIVRDADSQREKFPEQVRLVEYGSEEAMAEYATAAVWVQNYQMVHYLNKGLLKKEGQTYIQMWHGSFGIKKIEGNCGYLNEDKAWTTLAKKNAEYTDYWISNSSFETGVYRDAFWGAGEILEYGHPRNDIFWAASDEVAQKVKNFYGLKEEKVVFYVPTFRDQDKSDVAKLRVEELLVSLQKRFGGEWIFAVRRHPRMKREEVGCYVQDLETMLQAGKVCDMTDYPDIQELLATADVVITDYSSAIFDFMLTGRPGFLLAEDYERYEDIRGLYYPLEQSPFPLARSGRELAQQIETFDADAYESKVAEFLAQKGSVEDGMAASRVVRLVKEVIDKDE